MPTHKQILQEQNSRAEAASAKAGAEADRLFGLIRTERDAIEKLTADHAEACRKMALGLAVDTTAILAEKSRRSDRLQGLESHYEEAKQEVVRTNADHVQTSRALQVVLDREKLQELEDAVTVANEKLAAAEQSYKEALQAQNAAVWERNKFRDRPKPKQ